MAASELQFSRDYDLPVAIVWDALIDADLVEGWLAAARIEPELGGLYWLDWQIEVRLAPTNGVITLFEEPVAVAPNTGAAARTGGRLEIDTDNIGSLAFSLESLPGGARGSRTRLRLTISVDTEPRMLGSTMAYWRSNFDQLEDLLRGHPVDWSTWQRDRGATWASYLSEYGS